MTVTLYDCSKERLAHLQWCARSFAKSLRIIYHHDRCVSYIVDVHEQNMIQELDNKEELKTSPQTSYNKPLYGSPTRSWLSQTVFKIKSWIKNRLGERQSVVSNGSVRENSRHIVWAKKGKHESN